MASLKTTYMGLELQSPLVVSSSTLTGKIDSIKQLTQCGAGAVVLKSLFEEDIRGVDDISITEEIEPGTSSWMENVGMERKPASYLAFIGEVKKHTHIPIIASINCHSLEDWGDYVRYMKEAGASALELNLAPMAEDLSVRGQDVEKQALKLVKKLRKEVDLPMAVKIGSGFSSLPHFTGELHRTTGIEGLVLFNRFWQPDINIDKMTFSAGPAFSCENDFHETLRWTGILAPMLDTDICAGRGIHSSKSFIKALLAGAATVQVCSVLYKEGIDYARTILDETREWMEKHGFESVDDFRGKAKTLGSNRRSFYQQLQYLNPSS